MVGADPSVLKDLKSITVQPEVERGDEKNAPEQEVIVRGVRRGGVSSEGCPMFNLEFTETGAQDRDRQVQQMVCCGER